jgi:hypothetical protein
MQTKSKIKQKNTACQTEFETNLGANKIAVKYATKQKNKGRKFMAVFIFQFDFITILLLGK